MTYQSTSGKPQRALDQVFLMMREFSHWRDQRDEIVAAALKQEVPVERIATEMGISPSTVRQVKLKVERKR